MYFSTKKSLSIIIIILLANSLFGQDFITINGNIKDIETKKPIELVHVYSLKYKLGSISNSKGDFTIKLPKLLSGDTLCFSHIVYGITYSVVQESQSSPLIIELKALQQNLSEVVITGLTVEQIFDSLIYYVPQNYSQIPIVLRGFYREKIDSRSKPDSFQTGTVIKEAIFDIYKNPYVDCWKNKNLNDKLRIEAWRNIKNFDEYPLPGIIGFTTNSIINNEILRSIKKSFVVKRKLHKEYDFKLTGVIPYLYGRAYIIEFDQKDGVEKQLNKGKFIIDVNTFALVQFESSYSPKGKEFNEEAEFMYMNIKVLSSNFKVQYNKIGDKWYPYYYESKSNTYVNIHKRGLARIAFKEEFKKVDIIAIKSQTYSQLIITDYNDQGISKFNKDEEFKKFDYKSSEIKKYDEKIWKDYNYINPSDLNLEK